MTNTGLKGCQSELRVAYDLASRGYEIFVQFGNCSCDLIALRDGVALRVEVRSGYYRDGKVAKTHRKDSSRHDVMAVVFSDSIKYDGLPALTTPPLTTLPDKL